tara:strand:- start:296 stop:490 length:195 start_codon:yes stop_codon:yes gene_type:complete
MSILKSGRPSENKKILNNLQEKGTVKINMNIPKSFHKKIKRLATDHDITLTDLVKNALYKYMNK